MLVSPVYVSIYLFKYFKTTLRRFIPINRPKLSHTALQCLVVFTTHIHMCCYNSAARVEMNKRPLGAPSIGWLCNVCNEQRCAGLCLVLGWLNTLSWTQSLLVCSTGRKRQPAAPAEEKQWGKTGQLSGCYPPALLGAVDDAFSLQNWERIKVYLGNM